MVGIDVGLYDFDRHNAIYFFIVSPDERIYLRYGGRDALSADSYLDLDSFALALEAGLAEHERWQAGALPVRARPTTLFPREMERLREVELDRGRCVECHMIGDYAAVDKELAGTLDKPRDMFRSPDVRDIGIHLDVPRGLVVERADGAAREAGLRAGDRVKRLDYDFRGRFGRPTVFHPIRARVGDDLIRDYLSRTREEPVVVALGEGLDSQLWRVDDGRVRWVSVDLPDAIRVRERFLPAHPRASHVAGSILEPAWLDAVPTSAPPFIAAAGVLMYFTESDVRSLLTRIGERFPGAEIFFDAIPPSRPGAP